MHAFLRTRAFFAVLTVFAALLALESLLTRDTLQGVLFLVAALAFGWRTATWSRGGGAAD